MFSPHGVPTTSKIYTRPVRMVQPREESRIRLSGRASDRVRVRYIKSFWGEIGDDLAKNFKAVGKYSVYTDRNRKPFCRLLIQGGWGSAAGVRARNPA